MIARLYDILFSILILVVISPILILVSLYILFHDGEPIFYRQNRIGLNGIEFSITYFIMLLALLFMGAGRYVSLDYWFKRKLYN